MNNDGCREIIGAVDDEKDVSIMLKTLHARERAARAEESFVKESFSSAAKESGGRYRRNPKFYGVSQSALELHLHY